MSDKDGGKDGTEATVQNVQGVGGLHFNAQNDVQQGDGDAHENARGDEGDAEDDDDGDTVDAAEKEILDHQMRIRNLRAEKAKVKSSFTRSRRKLGEIVDVASLGHDADEERLERVMENLHIALKTVDVNQRTAMETMSQLSYEFLMVGSLNDFDKLCEEMEKLESEFSDAEKLVADHSKRLRDSLFALHKEKSRTEKGEVSKSTAADKAPIVTADQSALSSIASRSNPISSTPAHISINSKLSATSQPFSPKKVAYRDDIYVPPPPPPEIWSMSRPVETSTSHTGTMSVQQLDIDAARNLRRVSIPKFTGNKRAYEGWKAAFDSCVDRGTSSTPEYKLLRLRECLGGEALALVENLGFSAAAYEVAKKRLDLKYGGTRRGLMMRLEQLESFTPIKDGFEKELEKLGELLDVVIVNLKESGQDAELGTGTLYITIQRKLSRNLLAKYKGWVYDNHLSENVTVLHDFINREAEYLSTAAETISGILKPESNQSGTTRKEKTARTFVTQNPETRGKKAALHPCKVCGKSHGLWACDDFKSSTVDQRWEIARKHQACFRCLGYSHQGNKCTRSRTCGIDNCKATHNRLLHQAQPARKDGTENKSKARAESINADTMMSTSPKFLALRTVPVYLVSGTKRIKVYALLDDASTKTYINEDVAAELGLEGERETLTVNVLNNTRETLNTSLVDFSICSLDGSVCQKASAYTTQRSVAGNLQVIDWNRHKTKWNHLENIKFPRELTTRPVVDILIGVDQSDLLYSIADIRGKPGEPVARLTPLGWTCIGDPEDSNTRDRLTDCTNFTLFSTDSDINRTLRRYWGIDESQDTEIVKLDDKEAMDTVKSTLSYDGCRYKVGLPWKASISKDHIPDSFKMALNRLENTEKRLERDEAVREAYSSVIGDYEKKGYVRKLLEAESQLPTTAWYLPHFPVLRPDKSTTKTRLVFDASAKTGGVALNDLINQGPKLQNELFSVLLRLRRDPVALMSDVSEMYCQIKLIEDDRRFHRFLWRDMQTAKQPDVYEFERVVFGINSSPFLAQYVVRQHAEKHREKYPLGAETILESTYMDDSMDSIRNVSAAVELYHQVSRLWETAGMHARKWMSNSPEVLRSIPAADCVEKVDLDKGELPAVKTLGVLWLPKEDNFMFNVNQPPDETITKRLFLKRIATLFDPLGFLSPYIVRARILLQELWAQGLDWDSPVEGELSSMIKDWFRELADLPEIRIPRCLRLDLDIVETVLHIFVDASQDAYGAAAYIRHVYDGGAVTSRLIASKCRVAPLQSISIPRLELMGAIVGLRLAEIIGKTLKIDNSHFVFWSDSMDTLFWIRGRSRSFKPFVSNRVGEIQRATDPDQWRYIPTKENPADLLTRGLSVPQLANEESWWNGPSFLLQDPKTWPENKIVTRLQSSVSKTEVKKQYRSNEQDAEQTFAVTGEIAAEDRLQPSRYSSWRRLCRVKAYVTRFLENCRLPADLRRGGALDPGEIRDAEASIIKSCQEEAFNSDIRALRSGKELPIGSKLLPLRPIFDSDGVLRSDGRLVYAEYLPWEMKYPIILPRGHHVTKLIIKDSHEQNNHGGTNQVLAHLSSRYWVMSAREAIREWERECMHCRRKKAVPLHPLMAPLPELRSKKSMRAFNECSVDYGGPFITKQGRGKSRQKRYLCLFTCLATRAVHLELAFSMDTDSFLNAFFRMASRRGLPEDVLSDNGSNFIGGDNELEALAAIDNLDKDKIQNATSSFGVRWHFQPPVAPHFSGVHEVMIKAAKRAIQAILGSADITDEELLSAVVGAEGLINSRPLTYQSMNPVDIVPLTPNHFLHGSLGGRFAPESVDTTDFNPRKRWRRVQELVRHFWNRWIQEWLPGLNARKKWRKDQGHIRVGDVVIVMSDNMARGKWPLGRVIETHPGKDGVVRVAQVKVGEMVMKRPVVKLCPLEHFSDDEAD